MNSRAGQANFYDFADDASENPTFYAELDNPQSTNKYQYTYNSPLNMVDPDGHCPPCFGPSISVGEGIEFLSNPSKALDKLQLKISGIGMIPGPGDAVETVNVFLSAGRGNYVEAAIDGAGVATGSVVTGLAVANRVRKIAKAASKADDVVEAGADVAIRHGNSALSTKPQIGYELADQTGDVKKVGVTGQKANQNGANK